MNDHAECLFVCMLQAKWQETSLAMLGPAAAEQVAAAAEEAAQQAEAAAETAAERARCELPGGAASRRQLSAELEAGGVGISRAGSCQISQDESPAPVAAAPLNAQLLEAQESLLQLSKALRRPGREGLQPQGSSNLACTLPGMTAQPAKPADADSKQHTRLQALVGPQPEQRFRLLGASTAGTAAAPVQMRGPAPPHKSVPDHPGKASSAIALFKPTPQRHGKNLLEMFTSERPMWEPHVAPVQGSLLPGAQPSAESAEPPGRLISPFAKAPTLQPRGAMQTHQGESAFSRMGPAGRADEASERIRAYRPEAFADQHQGAAQHAEAGWTVANMDAGWAAVPCLAAPSTFPKASEVQRMWQQHGRDSTSAQHAVPGGHWQPALTGAADDTDVLPLNQAASRGSGPSVPAAFHPWGMHDKQGMMLGGQASTVQQREPHYVQEHMGVANAATGQAMPGSRFLSNQQTPHRKPTAAEASPQAGCCMTGHAGITDPPVLTTPSHHSIFPQTGTTNVKMPASPVMHCRPSSTPTGAQQLSPHSPVCSPTGMV